MKTQGLRELKQFAQNHCNCKAGNLAEKPGLSDLTVLSTSYGGSDLKKSLVSSYSACFMSQWCNVVRIQTNKSGLIWCNAR